MKKHLKELLPAIILCFVASFMLFIYEPIITYSANIDDFWFDFKLMLPNIGLYFALLFTALLIVYIIIYFLSYLITKKSTFFRIILLISFIGYLYTYIQGNYLVGNLPTLDGSQINWGSYVKENIISVIAVVVLIGIEIVLCIKVKLEKTIKYNKFVCLATFLMLAASLASALLKPGIFKEKIVATATNRNINNASSNKNFMIFLIDAVDSMAFSDALKENDKYASTFDDFTYYPDTVSAYTFTRDAIPFMFSGIWNENETEFEEYCNNAFNKSPLLKELKEQDYDMNFYEYQIHWSDRNVSTFSNVDIYNDEVDNFKFFKELSKYVLFKYLPYPLKQYSRIENADFDTCRIDEEGTYFSWNNRGAYDNIKDNEIEVQEKNYFQFLHIEGGHAPFHYDEDVNRIPEEEGTYIKQVTATINIVDSYLERLKEFDVYDNSVIIILADHGYWYNNNGRQNPVLLIKGIDEHHKMETSEIPVSYEDLCDAYNELLNGKKSEDLFGNIDKNRVRRFLYNGFNGEDSMEEYEQRGKAWDKSATVETGRVFNR